MKPGEIVQSIDRVISDLMKMGLCDQQNYCSSVKLNGGLYTSVEITGRPSLTDAMKNSRYEEIFNTIKENKAFHCRMLDDSVIQMLYLFEGEKLISHRLSFLPSPYTPTHEEYAEIYQNDDFYGEVMSEMLVKFPIRFDYSDDDTIHKVPDHPKSHLTLGQYKNCRIPVNAPLTPKKFINFILRNFYHVTKAHEDFRFVCSSGFPDSIHNDERAIPHLNL